VAEAPDEEEARHHEEGEEEGRAPGGGSAVRVHGARLYRERRGRRLNEPADHLGAEAEPFGAGDLDDAPLAAPSWPGAVGQMVAAVLVVLAVVSLFIAAAVVLRRLLP
jgi:hypothetical protein